MNTPTPSSPVNVWRSIAMLIGETAFISSLVFVGALAALLACASVLDVWTSASSKGTTLSLLWQVIFTLVAVVQLGVFVAVLLRIYSRISKALEEQP